MKSFPTLETDRLLLRRLELADAPDIQALLDNPEVIGNLIDTTPLYTLNDAETMIKLTHAAYDEDNGIAFAITRKSDQSLVGYCELELRTKHQRGKITYWIGRPFWWQGYATEAAKCVVRFGFEDLKLNRVFAYVLIDNSASAGVLKKAGLQLEGTQRQAAQKDGEFRDVEFYGLLRDDFQAAKAANEIE